MKPCELIMCPQCDGRRMYTVQAYDGPAIQLCQLCGQTRWVTLEVAAAYRLGGKKAARDAA